MDVTLRVEARRTVDETHSLLDWLQADGALRGRVRQVRSEPPPGVLGPGVDSLVVALGPGGVATALATVLVTWIRRRTSDVTLKVTGPDGETYELNVTNVGNVDAAAVQNLARRLAAEAGSGE
ncbi:MAG: hypothetical protein HOQ24_10210 [Mycobacteriaceae bacterium]|nr:hypothetical protein [Mycobacteriaceae bacterium]